MNTNYRSEETPWQIALPVLRQLSVELEGGIRALARQDLSEFEKHIEAQGKICDILLQTGVIQPADSATQRKISVLPAEDADSLRKTLQTLDYRKRVFAALMARAKRYGHVMLAVYQSQRGYSEKGPLPIDGNTWSSEV